MSLEAGLTLFSLVVAGVLYVIRAEIKGDVTRIDGRINTHEAGCTERQKGITAQFVNLTEHVERIDHRSERIEDKLDRVLAG